MAAKMPSGIAIDQAKSIEVNERIKVAGTRCMSKSKTSILYAHDSPKYGLPQKMPRSESPTHGPYFRGDTLASQ